MTFPIPSAGPENDAFFARIVERWPGSEWLLGKPGVFDILKQAIRDYDAGKVITQEGLLDRISRSAYWQHSTQSQRAFDQLQYTDPGEAWKQVDLANRQVTGIAQRLGVTLDAAAHSRLSYYAVSNGLSDQDLYNYMALGETGHTGTGVGGEVATQMSAVQSLAADYGVQITNNAAADWARQILSGRQTKEGMQGYFEGQAKSLYPGLASVLNNGVTVRQWADPMVALASKELEVAPDTIKLNDPKWQAMLQTPDQKGGLRPMTLDEWQTKIRSDHRYGWDHTTGAKNQAAQFEQKLAETFGAV